MHASTAISWDNSKRVLPENQMTDADKIMQVTLKKLLPGAGNDCIFHATFKSFWVKLF